MDVVQCHSWISPRVACVFFQPAEQSTCLSTLGSTNQPPNGKQLSSCLTATKVSIWDASPELPRERPRPIRYLQHKASWEERLFPQTPSGSPSWFDARKCTPLGCNQQNPTLREPNRWERILLFSFFWSQPTVTASGGEGQCFLSGRGGRTRALFIDVKGSVRRETTLLFCFFGKDNHL